MSHRSARRQLANFLQRSVSRRRKRGATHLIGGGRNLHLVGAIALMLGLLLQATQYSNALAAPFEESFEQLTNQSGGDVAPAPQVVVAVGDFQSQLGCGDYDINCGATQLTDQGGYWSGSFPIPAGDYNYQIGTVGADGNVYAFGQGGLNGDAQGLSISEGQSGAYFSFNSSTYEVDAQALDAIAVLNTDLGTFSLDGNLSTIIFAPGPGSISFQLLLNGEPVSDTQTADLEAGPNRISVNSDGSLNDVDSLGYASVTVSRTVNGEPASGSCFQVLDGGSVIGSGCDLDDGNGDGSTTILFAGGADSGNYTLREVTAPDGAETADDQDIQIDNGDNFVEVDNGGSGRSIDDGGDTADDATVEEDPTEEVAENIPGDLIVSLLDEDGNPIGDACFELVNEDGDAAESCDRADTGDTNPDNGNTGFFGVPSGTYTLRLSEAPDGVESADEQQVEVVGNETTNVQVTAQLVQEEPTEEPSAEPTQEPTEEPSAEPTQEPTEEPSAEPTQEPTDEPAPTEEAEPTEEPEAQPGDLIVSLLDEDGNPIGDACFELVNENDESAESCDRADTGDTNPGNGNTGFFGVPSGTYTLRLSDAPDGVESVDEQQVEVIGNETTNVQVTAQLVQEEPTEEPSAEPTDEATAEPTEEAEPTDEPAPTEEAEPTEETTEPDGGSADGPPGDLIVSLVDGDENPIGGACFQLVNPDESVAAESCDSAETGDTNPDNGNTGFFGVASGDYTLRQTLAPEGSESIEDTTITVQPGTSTNEAVVADVAAEPTAEPTDEPTAEPTDEPTVEPTAEPTDEPTVEPTAEPELGSLLITAVDEEGTTIDVPRFCVALEELGQQLCDGGQVDTDPETGNILVEGLELGTYTVSAFEVPEGYDAVEGTGEVVIQSGDEPATLELVFALQSPESGIVTINVIDDASEEPIAAGCFDITNESGTFNFCDDDADGTITIPDVAFGTQTVTQTSAAAGYAVAPEPQEFEVSQDEAEVTVTVRNTVDTGSILVGLTEGEATLAVEGTCLTIDGLDLVPCDNQIGDVDPAVGSILVENVPFGSYDVTVSTAPDGYVIPEVVGTADVVSADEPAVVSLPLELAPPVTGAIDIVATDTNDAPLPGACWSLANSETTIGPLCDDDADGVTSFPEVPEGTWTLTETTAPVDYTIVAPAEITIAAGENDAIRVAHELAPITVSVSTSDGQGGAPDGACYAIDGAEPICDIDGDGIVNFENVVPGVHVFTQTTPPTGYQAVDAQEIEIIPGDVESVVFTNDQTVNGALVVSVLDPDGNPVGGVDVTIGEGNAITDNASNDGDPAAGSVRFDDLEAGDYSVTISGVPVEFVAPEATPVTVVSGETATLEISLTDAPEQTGSVEVQLQDAEGNPTDEGCVILSNSVLGETLGPFCDGGEGDNNGTAGTVLLEEVPVGTWNVSVPAEDTGGQAITAADAGSSKTIQVQANVIVIVIIIIIGPPTEGALQITTRDSDTNATLAGACYELTSGATTIDVCDNDDTDNNGTAGIIRVSDLEPGTYSITLTNEIPGYTQEDVPTADVEAGTLTYITVELVASQEFGTVVVNKVDAADEPLGNACFALRQNNVIIFEQCDATDAAANDGQVVFNDVPAGIYRLIETQAPSSDYLISENLQITVVAGESAEYTRVNTLKPADLIVRKVDAANGSTLLPGACFSLQNGNGDTIYGSYCDSSDGTNDGRTRFDDVPVGEYTLVEDVAPYGYARAGEVQVTIQAGGNTQVVNVENELLPPPEETGSLIIYKEDGTDNILKGACFRLYDGANPLTNTICDGTDGSNDGVIRFNDVPVGTFELRETVAPSDAYQAAAPQDVEINEDETTEVTVVNTLKTGRIRIEKTNTDGTALQNACFDILEDDAGAQCTNANGITIFEDLAPGSYTLRETQAPYGYLAIKDKTGITVYAAKTTTVEVVDQRIPPDPNTGSVQVLKFYCPAGDSGERTSFLGASAGNSQLAKTAGCEAGNAGFNLDQDNGNGGPGDFTVGNDGRYQVSVPSGTYTLSETDPDLEGNSTVKVAVYKGQLTTVIVINYIAPPAPDPITVDVTKWTCTPSFNGTLYDDFAQNCTEDEQLTNNITFRAEGPVEQKQVTGDGGQLGKTSFTGLTEGTYSIYEETPYTIPTSYGFCGTDPAWPADYKVVNGAFNVELGWGDTLTCHYFNIPEDVTDTTGVVLVRKFVCNIASVPKGYDFFEECDLSDQNATFALNSYNGKTGQFQEFTQGTANNDGFLRFTKLKPGTYELKEVGEGWCFAESDSVDSNGDVVVKAGKVSTVFIFNCVPTKEPPNTGSGDAADNPPPGEDVNPDSGTETDGGRAPIATPAIAWGWPILLALAHHTGRRRARLCRDGAAHHTGRRRARLCHGGTDRPSHR